MLLKKLTSYFSTNNKCSAIVYIFLRSYVGITRAYYMYLIDIIFNKYSLYLNIFYHKKNFFHTLFKRFTEIIKTTSMNAHISNIKFKNIIMEYTKILSMDLISIFIYVEHYIYFPFKCSLFYIYRYNIENIFFRIIQLGLYRKSFIL